MPKVARPPVTESLGLKTSPFRYKRLGYLVFDVTDIERSTRFAMDVFGLDLVDENADGGRCFRGGLHHHDVIFRQASRPMVVRSAWELEDATELEKAFAHFAHLGRDPVWLAEHESELLKVERAFRVHDEKLGLEWEFFVDMTVMPMPRTNRLTSFQGGKHFGLVMQDAKGMCDTLVDQMGFKVSDYFEGYSVTLLRAWPNPNHHSLALMKRRSDGPVRFHHVAFMVDQIDDIGRLFNRVQNMGIDIQFGIGRHPTSNSIHLYIYDHDNFVWEYTFGMEQFSEEGARQARRMSAAPEDFDLWGAVPDASRKNELPVVLTHLEP